MARLTKEERIVRQIIKEHGAQLDLRGNPEVLIEIVRKHGGLCIADEVQTAFGRTGEHYWGFENWGVTPDLVTMAKGLGNGVPIGACVARPEIAAMMKNRVHFNTFGGNPVSMTQGLATLEVIDAENLQANAKAVGGHLKDRLLELQERHDATTLSQAWGPPRERGTTWSMFSAARLQYWQR